LSGDVLPIVVGIVLVAVAAAFALLPFVRGSSVEPTISEEPSVNRFELYQQVVELEFDYQVGKLAEADYKELSTELLAQAGEALREERGNVAEVDAEIEHEIAAARAAFAAARRVSPAEAR
jgi:cytochrome c-type biogenesis protein CcmI